MQRIGAYEVVRLIALGGTATVYEARQPALDRTVALKRLDLRTNDPVLVERFIQESRIAASFDHPNIVTVHDFFECDGVPYIAMEYLRRGSLRPWVRHVSTAQAFGALEGILAALRHAEKRGIAHRDLKPENVLLTQAGGVKIADFGIAKAYMRATEQFTSPGTAVGTPTYMAPEQAQGRSVGPYTDLYAVGVIAFELLSGAPPFSGATSVATLYRHVNELPPSLTAVQPDVDPGVAAWVAQLLEKDPAARPASARDAWAGLEELAVGLFGPFWRRDAAIEDGLEPTDAEAGRQHAPTRPAARLPPAGTAFTLRSTGARAHPRRRLVAGLLAALVAGAALAGFGLAEMGGGAGAGGGPPPVPTRSAIPTPAAAAAAAATAAGKPYDFRGDGHAAIVAGLPGRRPPRGAGIVVLGTPGVVTERSLGLAGADTNGDAFGTAMASGDFDRDGHADLAVGAPGRNAGSRRRIEGAVTVLPGTPTGLGHRPVASFKGPGNDFPYRDARFGEALAAGDLNGDGYADLVVGAPGADARPAVKRGSGAITILFGGPHGLSRSRARTLRRPGNRDGRFGSVLRLGDVNHDRHLDIVEGAPGAPTSPTPGHVSYCAGRPAGPKGCRTIGTGVAGAASLAIGDVTGDGFPDIVQGVPDYGLTAAGAVFLWEGTSRGPRSQPVIVTQQTRGVAGSDEPGDEFGTAVAVTDADRDGFADILVGIPGEDAASGRAELIFGGRDLGVAAGGITYLEGQRGLRGSLTPGYRFGATLQLRDTNGDHRPDLVVGAPGDGGALFTLPGTNGGFSRVRARVVRLAPPPGGAPDVRLGG